MSLFYISDFFLSFSNFLFVFVVCLYSLVLVILELLKINWITMILCLWVNNSWNKIRLRFFIFYLMSANIYLVIIIYFFIVVNNNNPVTKLICYSK